MKILFAADGSKYTKKAIAFLVTHESLAGPSDEVVVLNVQAPLPVRVRSMLGAAEVTAYQAEESRKVLEPIDRFLKRHNIKYRTLALVGLPTAEILRAAKREKAHMIVTVSYTHLTLPTKRIV